MFRTELQVPPSGVQLNLQDKVLTIGSCFAEVIGGKLQQSKANVLVNPFGTIFNPVSVCLLLQAAAGKPYHFEEHLVEHNGIWYAYDLHSSLSSPSKDDLLRQIEEKLAHTRRQLMEASLLIITLGTSVAYRLHSNGNVVANCHKMPARNFERMLLGLPDMQEPFEKTLALLNKANPALQVVLTVSPVRHVKETLTLNSVSKASLRVLCHQLTEKYANCHYFPAFEIMVDDLRDYRFYKEDMLHPTTVAEDYIWQRFVAAYYTQGFRDFLDAWQKIQRAVAHRPFQPQSAAHQAFLQSTLQQLARVREQYQVVTDTEEQLLREQLL